MVLPLKPLRPDHLRQRAATGLAEACASRRAGARKRGTSAGRLVRHARWIRRIGLGENEEGETYICGNPPYKGSKWQTDCSAKDLATLACVHLRRKAQKWKSLDYVAGWYPAKGWR